jgi:hypothetical protein
MRQDRFHCKHLRQRPQLRSPSAEAAGKLVVCKQ